MFKYLISILAIFFCSSCFASTYVSLSPVPTEIIYALGAEDNLLGVSTTCNYPEQVKNKVKIGDTYFVNFELLLNLKPDYLFSMSSGKVLLGELKLTKTKPVYFEFSTIDDIYHGIDEIAKLVNKEEEGKKLVNEIQTKIKSYKTQTPKKILYLIQTYPMITIGNKSFLNDVIEKSGQISVTKNLNYYYPSITAEYAMSSTPDVIVVCFPSDISYIKKLFPNVPILFLNAKQRDIINRSGPRVYEAIKLFAELNFSDKP